MLSNSPLNLLPPDALIKTGVVDHADWNYRPILGSIQRLRYRLVLSLLSSRRYPRLLEVGYGSGVFMPELSRRSLQLYGIDVHKLTSEVSQVLAKARVAAELSTASVTHMPFDDQFFDCIIAVSSLEFVEDLRAACKEIKRVLKPSGEFIVITPGNSALLDWGLKMLTGKSAKEDFEGRREQIIPCLQDSFAIEKKVTAPRTTAWFLPLYTGLRLRSLK